MSKEKPSLLYTTLFVLCDFIIFLRLSSLPGPDTCEIDVLENMSKVSKGEEKQESRMKWREININRGNEGFLSESAGFSKDWLNEVGNQSG